MKRVNGYLREEFPGERKISKNLNLEKLEGQISVEELKQKGLSDFEIRKLRIEAE